MRLFFGLACIAILALLAGGAPAQEKDAPKEFTNDIGMQLVWLPPGTFMMGSPKSEVGRKGDETLHKVTLTKGFYMGVYPVTGEQWQAVMGKNPAVRKGKKLPVENVSWLDCQEFLQKVGKKDGRAYRLPTEAEWEYACRAGTTTAFSFGETISTQQANYDGLAYGAGKRGAARKKTTPVDTFPPNKWGLRDMHGNVYNWCADWYGPYPTGDAVDPKGPAATAGDRVMRGGSFVSNPSNLRSACRHPYAPIYATYNVGFRVAL